jgi:hypothetical protein
MSKTWLERWELPECRQLQPHEKVQAGDYMQIGDSYVRIDAEDSMLPGYKTFGGPYGTFWRATTQRRGE